MHSFFDNKSGRRLIALPRAQTFSIRHFISVTRWKWYIFLLCCSFLFFSPGLASLFWLANRTAISLRKGRPFFGTASPRALLQPTKTHSSRKLYPAPGVAYVTPMLPASTLRTRPKNLLFISLIETKLDVWQMGERNLAPGSAAILNLIRFHSNLNQSSPLFWRPAIVASRIALMRN